MPVWYRLPDAGMPARIVTPKIAPPKKLSKPRGVYTKGPITSQGVRISPPKPRPKTSIRLSNPTIKMPTRMPSASGGGGGISLPGASPGTMMSISGLRSNSQLKKMAHEAVMLEAQPQINALGGSYNTENSNFGYLINGLRKQLGLSKGDINTLYSTLDANLAFNAKDQGKINADTKNKMGQIYDQLSSQIGGNYQTAQNATTSELNRLGIKNPQADDRLTRDKTFLQSQASQSKTNSTALMDAINASTQGMMQGLRAGSAATSAMLQSGLQQQFDKQSGDAMQKHLATLGSIKMQMSSLKSSIPSKINQTYQALLDQQYQREMDAAQKLFDNQIKLGNFQLSTQNAQSTAQYRQNQLALEAQRIANQAAQSKKSSAPALKGTDKALAYLQTVAKKSHVPYSTLENVLIDAINGDPNRPVDMPGFNKAFSSGYASDINNSLKSRGLGSLYTDLVRSMNYWFGG